METCKIDGCTNPIAIKMRKLCNTHYQYWALENSDRYCTYPGCDKKHNAKGYCVTHYVRYKTGADMDGWKNPGCSIKGCFDQHYANSYCRSHYDKIKRRGTVDPIPLASENECHLEFCDRPSILRDPPYLCHTHYNHHYLGNELKPIRPTNKRQKPGPDGKVCQDCLEYKTYDNYYFNKTGKDGRKAYRAYCKTCMIKRANNYKARQDALS